MLSFGTVVTVGSTFWRVHISSRTGTLCYYSEVVLNNISPLTCQWLGRSFQHHLSHFLNAVEDAVGSLQSTCSPPFDVPITLPCVGKLADEIGRAHV